MVEYLFIVVVFPPPLFHFLVDELLHFLVLISDPRLLGELRAHRERGGIVRTDAVAFHGTGG